MKLKRNRREQRLSFSFLRDSQGQNRVHVLRASGTPPNTLRGRRSNQVDDFVIDQQNQVASDEQSAEAEAEQAGKRGASSVFSFPSVDVVERFTSLVVSRFVHNPASERARNNTRNIKSRGSILIFRISTIQATDHHKKIR